MNDHLQVLGNRLSIGDDKVTLRYPADKAIAHHDLVIVLYSPTAEPGDVGVFANVEAIRRNGSVEWTAQLPSNQTGECYYDIEKRGDGALVARSFTSYVCALDWTTGRITERTFVK